MIVSGFLIGLGLGLLTAALVITVYKLTTSKIKQRVKDEIPETEYVVIEKMITDPSRGRTVLPKYTAKAYNRQRKKIRDIEFKYEDSEYFYNGEKIYV